MTTGQTMLAVGALVLLTTIMMNFYRIFGHSWDTVDATQMGIDATTIATSFMEVAHGLSFDEISDTTYITNLSQLTAPGSLGREGAHDDSLHKFNDFDDFHGFETEVDAGENGTYGARFEVHYVEPTNVMAPVNYRTYTKRLDMWIWRQDPPPPPGFEEDSLSMFTVMGYFTFQ
jgi:hypothetical protein